MVYVSVENHPVIRQGSQCAPLIFYAERAERQRVKSFFDTLYPF